MTPRIAAQLNYTPSNTELRITPNNFDLVRLLAASQVVLVHGIEHLELTSIVSQHFTILWRLVTAFPGVPIFFVVSGFLISRSLEREPCLWSYTVNRMLRIYPALIACFLVSVLSVLVVSPENILTAAPLRFVSWMIAQLTFLQFYNPDFLRSYGVGTLNGSLWTIPIELQFYILLPLTYFMLGLRNSQRNFQTLLLIVLFIVLSRVTTSYGPIYLPELVQKILVVSFVPYFWMFLIGVLAQRNWRTIRRFFEDRILLWLVGYFFLVYVLTSLGMNTGGNSQTPIASISLAGLVFAFAFSWRTLSERMLMGNDISYGTYIYHMVVINLLAHLGYTGSFKVLISMYLITLGLACISWIIVEKPALRKKLRSSTKRATTPATSLGG